MVNLASPRLLNLPAWRRNARPAALMRAYTPAKMIAITTVFVQLKMSLVEDLNSTFGTIAWPVKHAEAEC